jgi:putative transposase
MEREASAERNGKSLADQRSVVLRRPPRLTNDLYIGPGRIFVTMCTFGRRPYFCTDATTDRVRRQLLQSAGCYAIEIVAYCFMPDHLHALISGSDATCDARAYLTFFRQSSGFAHRGACGTRLWQQGYFDRHLRDRDATLDVVSYIVCNPVRGGLCESPEQYRWSGSSVYELGEIVRDVQWRPRSAKASRST